MNKLLLLWAMSPLVVGLYILIALVIDSLKRKDAKPKEDEGSERGQQASPEKFQ